MRVVELTPREMQIVGRLLEDGSDYETIGRRMGISINTVKTHIRKIYKKTEVPNRVALVLALGHRELRVKEAFRPTLTKCHPAYVEQEDKL